MSFRHILLGLSFLTLPTLSSGAMAQNSNAPGLNPNLQTTSSANSSSIRQSSIFLGRVDGRAPNSVSGVGLNTQSIDPILNIYTNLGPNFTARQAQSAFDEIDDLEQDLEEMVMDVVFDQNFIRSADITFDSTPFHLQLSQTGTSLNLGLGGVSGAGRVRVNTSRLVGTILIDLVCPTLRADVEVQNVSASGSYDVFSGTAQDFEADFDIVVNDVSCSFSRYSFLANILLNDSIIENIANNKAQNFLEDSLDGREIPTMLGIQDFITSLREYVEIVDVTFNQFPQAVTLTTPELGEIGTTLDLPQSITVNNPVSQGAISREANMVLDSAERIIGGFAGTNLQLDVFLDNDTKNELSFIVSNVENLPRTFAAYDELIGRQFITYQTPNEPTPLRIFAGNRHAATDTLTGNGFLQFIPLPREIVRREPLSFSSENHLIGGVYSFATRVSNQRVDLRNRADHVNFLEIFGPADGAIGINERFTPPPPTPRTRRRTPTQPATPPPPGEEPPCSTCPFR